MTAPRELPASVRRPARFVALHDVPESDRFAGARLEFAVIVARAPEGIVLVFNNFRHVWELPGGLVDAGEHPRDSACRELREEGACEARNVRWLGVTEVSDGITHHGAVYACEADAHEFSANVEIGGRAWWQAALAPEPLGHTDAALLQIFGNPA